MPRISKFANERSKVLAFVKENRVTGVELRAQFPHIPRATLDAWAKDYLGIPRSIGKPRPTLKPVRTIANPAPDRPEDVPMPISVSALVDEAATYFDYRTHPEDAIASIDRHRAWMLAVLMEIVTSETSKCTTRDRIHAVGTMRSVVNDREACIRAERQILQPIEPTDSDAQKLIDYLRSQSDLDV